MKHVITHSDDNKDVIEMHEMKVGQIGIVVGSEGYNGLTVMCIFSKIVVALDNPSTTWGSGEYLNKSRIKVKPRIKVRLIPCGESFTVTVGE